ncbi:MAG TPA: acetyl ornithine aminotransferase family protein [Terriglobia bacterium]|nr:acetyl ornithine aminotransferase family protein [Terriglobia bacterium]
MATQVTDLGKLPRIITDLPGPKAKAIIESDHRNISPSYTRSYPLVAERASGAIVEDSDGNHFLDFSAGIAVVSTGHCHPDIVRVIQDQAAALIHMSGTDFYYRQMPDLASKLSSLIPDGKDWRCFFGNSGAEAIEAAIKLARYATRRFQLIAFHNSFHGRTMGALSLTASKPVQRKRFGPLLAGVTHIPYPNPFHCPLGAKPENVGEAVLEYLEDVIFRTTVAPDEVAAIVVEAIQGEGGYVVPPANFLKGLQEIAQNYGILIIADEVQSGMGRTGKMFAFEHFDCRPDIIALAKGIASGLPLGVMMARSDLMTWEPGAHASTFGGNPVSLAAALETIRLLQDQYISNSARVGAFLKSRLVELMAKHPRIGDVRGFGLMIGIQVVRKPGTNEWDPALRDNLIQECFSRGLLVLGAGSSSIRLSPPLMIDEEQAECAVGILESAMVALSI